MNDNDFQKTADRSDPLLAQYMKEDGTVVGGAEAERLMEGTRPRKAQPLDDGGPAFPLPAGDFLGEDRTPGMSLRAHIANTQLAALIARGANTAGDEHLQVARHAVKVADALIAALKGGA